MDVRNLNHYLVVGETETLIEEPSGFDKFALTMKRTDYHGMSVEVSEGTLGFYRVAAQIVEAAYNEDIETKVEYIVKDGNTELYHGVVDLSTFSKKSEQYSIVECNVGEIGTKTTFNNRVETEVDLNTTKTIDGADMSQTTWHNVSIPARHLIYTNIVSQKADGVIKDENRHSWNDRNFMLFQTSKADASEFGTVNSGGEVVIAEAPFGSEPSIFSENEDFVSTFGTGTTMDITGKVRVYVEAKTPTMTEDLKRRFITCRLCIYNENGDQISSDMDSASIGYDANLTSQNNLPNYATLEIDVDTKGLPTSNKIFIGVQIYGIHYSDATITGKVLAGTKLTMRMYDTLVYENVSADTILVHDALNVIAGAISENAITVKSDWYGSPKSGVNPTTQYGGGFSKTLTNGYKIRGLYTTDEDKRNMPLSFKDAIKSLDSLDCIGWGFEKSDGEDYVRVERAKWFYKYNNIITVSGVKTITRQIDTDGVYSTFKIGYKKYETNDSFNSIDSIHGERTFTNGIKAVANTKDLSCDFVADNYAIELTRRAKKDVDVTEEFGYDENIFVFECAYNRTDNKFELLPTASSGDKVGNINELINAKLSPRRCAERWREFIFQAVNTTPYRFTSGTINYQGGLKTMAKVWTKDGKTYFGLEDDLAGNTTTYENKELPYTDSYIKAETIEFEYPISKAQYDYICANPYGLVKVNGMEGWIKELRYEFVTGKAKFTLLAIGKHQKENDQTTENA